MTTFDISERPQVSNSQIVITDTCTPFANDPYNCIEANVHYIHERFVLSFIIMCDKGDEVWVHNKRHKGVSARLGCVGGVLVARKDEL